MKIECTVEELKELLKNAPELNAPELLVENAPELTEAQLQQINNYFGRDY